MYITLYQSFRIDNQFHFKNDNKRIEANLQYNKNPAKMFIILLLLLPQINRKEEN